MRFRAVAVRRVSLLIVTLALASVLLFAPRAVVAQTPPPASPQGRTFATLSVNGNLLGDALIALIGDDIFLRVSDLGRSGITKFAGTRRTIAGEEYVSLRSLSPDYTYTFDVKALALDVIAHQASLLGSRILDLREHYPANTRYQRNAGAFMDYSIAQSETGRPVGFFESGVTLPRALLYNTFQYGRGGFTRGLSQLVYDDRARLRRTTLGDGAAGSGPLGGAAVVLGAVVSRQFDLDPFLLTFPTPALAGQVLLPSQADIYVNGRLVRTIDLAPGQYILNDIPATLGVSQTQVVVRDATGVVSRQGSEFFSIASLLRPGLSDFAFAGGLARSGSFGGSGYRDPVFLGRYALGISNHFTLGGRLEAGKGVVSGGLNVVRTAGNLAFQVALAGSESRGTSGAAASVQLSRPNRGALGLGGFAQWQSQNYSTLSIGPFDPRPLWDVGGTLSFLLSHSTALSVTAQNIIDSKTGPQSALSVTLSQQLGHSISLLVQDTRVRGSSILGATQQNTITASLIRPIGTRGTLGVSRSVQSGSGNSGVTSVAFNHSPGDVYGLAYDVNAGFGNGRNFAAGLQYQGLHGSAQLFASDSASGRSATFAFGGAVVFVRKHLFLTRSINDAFGLVQLPGLAGASVFANNRYEGKTNAAGLLVVPDLVSEVPNEVRLELPEKALDATVSGNPAPIVPSFRSSVLFAYDVQRVRAVLVELLIAGKTGAPIVPIYGQLTVTAGAVAQVSEIDGAGRAYFNNLPEGKYAAKIELSPRICQFELTVPPHEQAVYDLGLKTCVEH